MEPIMTRVRPRWHVRLVLLAVAFAVFAGWFAYDGIVTCPAFNRRASLYNALVVEQVRRGEWLALARAKGWPPLFSPEETGDDGRVRLHSDLGIKFQLGLAVVAALATVVLVVRVGLNRRLTVVLDDEGLLVAGRDQRIPLSQITGIDRQRWENRGIVRIEYDDERGARRHLVLNDSIHAHVAEIAAWIESQLSAARSAS